MAKRSVLAYDDEGEAVALGRVAGEVKFRRSARKMPAAAPPAPPAPPALASPSSSPAAVPASEIHTPQQLAAHILAHFGAFNLHNLAELATELDLALFRLYLYAVVHNQRYAFLAVPQHRRVGAAFGAAFDKVSRLVLDASFKWDGTTYKDRFLAGDSVRAVKLAAEQPARTVKRIALHPIVAKRLGLNP
ncbi:hypothetical protein ABC855_g2426 [[Candida] zeylanoides]